MPSIADVRAFWDRQPCTALHSGHIVGTKEYFADLSARKYFVQPHVPPFAEFSKWTGKKVLEVGCGVGTDAEEFAKAGADYTGIDLSPASIALAAGRFALLKLSGHFIVGDAESLPSILPIKPFDLIYCFGVLHHTPDPGQVLGQLRKYMNAESTLRVMIYAEHSFKAAMIDAGLDQSEAQANCPIARRYTTEEATKLLTGFEIVRLWQDHVFPYEVGPYKKYRYKLQPWFDAMSPEMFAALERKLGWHMMIWARLAKPPAAPPSLPPKPLPPEPALPEPPPEIPLPPPQEPETWTATPSPPLPSPTICPESSPSSIVFSESPDEPS